MKYKVLTVRTERNRAELLQAILFEEGFTTMQIDDPLDAADIADNPELYKYDYINEEILRQANAVRSNDRETSAAGARIIDDRITLTLYFSEDGEGREDLSRAEKILEAVRSAGMSQGSAVAESTPNGSGGHAALSWETAVTGDDSEWLYKWQEHFKPARIGERVVVKPGWEDYEAEDGDLVIEMDPGMAFGSGLHETTSMCIKALEKTISDPKDHAGIRVRAESLKEMERCGSLAGGTDTADNNINHIENAAINGDCARPKVLDVGTGTGILAMAAVLLGADEALGIDIDDEAVRVSNENIVKNGLEGRISIRHGNLMDGIDYDPDIIVANLMADLVMMLSPAAAAQLKPGGLYITSGILDIKEETVAEAVREAGFEIKEIMADGEWRAIIAVKC